MNIGAREYPRAVSKEECMRPEMQDAQPRRRRRARLSLWNRFVLLVGYLALLYGLCRGIIYLLVLLNGAVGA